MDLEAVGWRCNNNKWKKTGKRTYDQANSVNTEEPDEKK